MRSLPKAMYPPETLLRLPSTVSAAFLSMETSGFDAIGDIPLSGESAAVVVGNNSKNSLNIELLGIVSRKMTTFDYFLGRSINGSASKQL